MLEWSYDELGASADMPGIESPTFFVTRALVGDSYIATECFPVGMRVVQPVPTLGKGIAWCNEAAQQLRALDSATPCPDCGCEKVGIHSIRCPRYRPPSQ